MQLKKNTYISRRFLWMSCFVMCFTTHVVFCDTVDAIYVVNITTNESNLSDNKETMNDLTHLDNDSAIDNSSTLSGVQRGNEILNKLRKHKFSERDKIHEDDIICNCNGALCDAELVQILGKQYKGKCRARRGYCFKVFEELPYLHMSVGCKPIEELQPIPIFCLSHPGFNMTCCNESFCDENIHMRADDFLFEDNNYFQWQWIAALIITLILLVFCLLVGWIALHRYPRLFYIMRKYFDFSSETVENIHNHRIAREEELPMLEGQAPAIQSVLLKGLESTDAGSGSGSGLPLLTQRTIARQIELITEIGQGRFGEVWLGGWKGDRVAVKIFSSRDESSWIREVETFQTHMLRHTNILRFIASDNKDTGTAMQLWLITEYHPNGSLFDYLFRETVDIKTLIKMVRSIANGLSFLHTELSGGKQNKPAIAHRDIKSKNILVKRNLTCVIADLGLAVRYEGGHINLPNSNKCGTVRYLPPEVLDDAQETSRFESYRTADIYALGLVIWEIARRTESPHGSAAKFDEALPYFEVVPRDPTIEEMRQVVVIEGLRPILSTHWDNSRELRDVCRVMKECWSVNPSSRLTAMNVRLSMDRLLPKEYEEY